MSSFEKNTHSWLSKKKRKQVCNKLEVSLYCLPVFSCVILIRLSKHRACVRSEEAWAKNDATTAIDKTEQAILFGKYAELGAVFNAR